MRGPLTTIIGLSLALGLGSTASAATIHVPADEPTIQDAIDVAVNGDLIIVAPGTYLANLDLLGKAITLRGTPVNPQLTVLQGTPGGTMMTAASTEGPDTIVEGFTFRGGNGAPGGALRISNSASPRFESCRFEDNHSSLGGAAYLDGFGAPHFEDCAFIGNSAGTDGGALHVSGATTLTVRDCRFVDNHAPGSGAAIYTIAPYIGLTNIRGKENSGPSTIHIHQAAAVDLRNGLLAENVNDETVIEVAGFIRIENGTCAGNDGVVLRTTGIGVAQIANSIMRSGAGNALDDGSGSLTVTYSNIKGGAAGTGNIDVLPRFVDAGENDYRLAWDSPCIDAAHDDELSTNVDLDLDGLPRRTDTLFVADSGAGSVSYLDMGCYETPNGVRFVDADATGANDGTTWADAYVDLQDALDAADADEHAEIWIADGVYHPDRGTGDRNATFRLVDGISLIGGFAGGELDRADADPDTNVTVLSGAIGDAGTNDNSYSIVTAEDVSDATRVFGVGIRRGYALEFPTYTGSAIRLIGSDVIFERCTVRACEAPMASVVFSDGVDSGGAPSSPQFRYCRFKLNENTNSVLRFIGGTPRLFHCIVHGNQLDAAGVYFEECEDAEVVNCTVTGNHSTSWAAGIFCYFGSVSITNTITWGNTREVETSGSPRSANYESTLSEVTLRHNTIEHLQSWLVEDGNHGHDPRFVDAAGPDGEYGTSDDDLRLRANSRSIDSGDTTVIPLLAVDFDGAPRMVDDLGMPDTGLGGPPVVDRGAYEFAGRSCLADIDGDGTIGFSDLLEILAAWGTTEASAADVDLDDAVGFSDLLVILAEWGPCPGS